MMVIYSIYTHIIIVVMIIFNTTEYKTEDDFDNESSWGNIRG